MLVPGTQMEVVTFGFVCLKTVILFYLFIYRLARPDDKISLLNIVLIGLLIIYNLTGGLLPDPRLPGSYFIQNCIAYATGFITPCYFPYYVYKVFGLEKMYFHVVILFGISGNQETTKNLLILSVLYAVWVIYSLRKSIRQKYAGMIASNKSKEEIAVLF